MLPILITTALFLYLFLELYWKRRNLPPGPTPILFFGNLLALNNPKPGYEAFDTWRKQYGPIYTFWRGTTPFIMIASYENLKETFIKGGETFVDKPLSHLQKQFRGGEYGVLDTNGEVWRDQRRFALMQLRDLGLGKDLMQEKILIEVEELQKELDARVGSEVNLPRLIDQSVGNVINLTLFGYRFEKEQAAEFAELKNLIDSQRDLISQFKYNLQMQIPFLEKIMPGKGLTELLVQKRRALDAFYMKQIEAHAKSINFDEQENSDFVEAYLKEQRKREADRDDETFSDKQLVAMCFDLWLAGLITTTITLTWGISYYLHDAGVQQKIHEELERVIGEERLVTMADRNSLTYLNAFINETQRCVNLLTMNLPHMTTKDTVIGGYPVKKGTGVVAQISSVMTDEKVRLQIWKSNSQMAQNYRSSPDPYRFNPDRFIENGKLRKVNELVPFSVGKRQCLGEGLARMELFLFFGNLFNRYTVTPSEALPDIDKSKQSIVLPREFTAVLLRN